MLIDNKNKIMAEMIEYKLNKRVFGVFLAIMIVVNRIKLMLTICIAKEKSVK